MFTKTSSTPFKSGESLWMSTGSPAQIGNNVVDADVSFAGDGALLATFGGETHRIFGMDEPLGLRLVLDGNTLFM